MLDPRMTKLADILVNYSCAVKEGEKILIEAIDVPHAFTAECVRAARSARAIPLVKLEANEVKRALMTNGCREGWELIADAERFVMDRVDCYIAARGSYNITELSDVPAELQRHYENTVWRRVHLESRCTGTRWVVIRWPHPSMAQAAGMSTSAFEDYFFDVCTMDYRKLTAAAKPLAERITRADRVRLLGPRDTDLTFSVAGMAALADNGKANIPDGEVCTAPVRDSANGVIHYNTPTDCRGEILNDIRFVLKNGQIVEATANDTRRLNEMLDADDGARYIGEFALGLNPYCTRSIKDGLFDEKIAGSIHFTPGESCQEFGGVIDNGNRSDIHWDIVMRQTTDVGGGEVYFDGELIRKDGLFVTDDLRPLNPENLK